MVIPRIAPANVKARLDAGESITIVDARLRYPFEHSSLAIAGTRRVGPGDSIDAIPADAEVVVFDSDPGEVVAEDVAYRLASRGTRVQVLAGGLNAWIAAGGATVTKPAVGQPASVDAKS